MVITAITKGRVLLGAPCDYMKPSSSSFIHLVFFLPLCCPAHPVCLSVLAFWMVKCFQLFGHSSLAQGSWAAPRVSKSRSFLFILFSRPLVNHHLLPLASAGPASNSLCFWH